MSRTGSHVVRGIAIVLTLGLCSCVRTGSDSRAARTEAGQDRAEVDVTAAGAAALDWCAEHEVPESECTRCNPGLIPAFKAKGDWCAEHDLPESQCVICDPGRRRAPPSATTAAAEGPQDARHALEGEGRAGGAEAFCSEHRVPEAICAICLPSVAPVLEVAEIASPLRRGPLVRLATVAAARKAGIRAVRAADAPSEERATVLAQVAFDEDRFARIACPAGGTVESISVDLGDRVRKGQSLLVVRSAEIAGARAEAEASRARLRLAEAEHIRRSALREKGLLPEREHLESERDLATARAGYQAATRRLSALGQEEPEGPGGAVSGTTGAGSAGTDGAGAEAASEGRAHLERLVLVSPLDGTVVAREVSPGQVVDGEEVLLEIADMRSFWVNLDLPEEQVASLRLGQPIRLTVDAVPGRGFEGSVIAIGGAVDRQNRMLRARARVEDPEGVLKANLFGMVTIARGSSPARALVPREALQMVEGIPVVFVRLEDDLFEARAVRIGAASEGRLPILAGVEPNEEVVTSGAFLLKTHISKGSIGAGCCDVVESLGKRR